MMCPRKENAPTLRIPLFIDIFKQKSPEAKDRLEKSISSWWGFLRGDFLVFAVG